MSRVSVWICVDKSNDCCDFLLPQICFFVLIAAVHSAPQHEQAARYPAGVNPALCPGKYFSELIYSLILFSLLLRTNVHYRFGYSVEINELLVGSAYILIRWTAIAQIFPNSNPIFTIKKNSHLYLKWNENGSRPHHISFGKHIFISLWGTWLISRDHRVWEINHLFGPILEIRRDTGQFM